MLAPVHIGPHRIDPPLVLSPMAGVTDRPFRVLCRRLGAGLAVSEMALADPTLRGTEKSRTRRDHVGEPGPIAVQLAGSDPEQLAEAALWNIGEGAELIDLKTHPFADGAVTDGNLLKYWNNLSSLSCHRSGRLIDDIQKTFVITSICVFSKK